MDYDPETSPCFFEPEFQVPQGVRIEAERYGRRWLCSLKGSTVSILEIPGGVVHRSDRVWVIPARESVAKQAVGLAMWLFDQGYELTEMCPVQPSVCSVFEGVAC